MPMPWKKARVSRISRLVADLQSPSRGNPMVVETGFPTSLVDLFVKNRERLKKPAKKKKKQRTAEELVISDPIPISNTRDELISLPIFVDSVNACRTDNLEEENRGKSSDRCDLVSEDLRRDLNQAIVIPVNKVPNENERGVLLVVLKMFVVVLLGLSTKRLTVGIAMSAFVLIFLEYVGKHVLCFLKPCSNALLVLETSIQRVFPSFMLKRVAKILEALKNNPEDSMKGLIIQQEDATDSDSCDVIENLELNCRLEEIQVVANLDMLAEVEENRGTEIHLDSVCSNKRFSCVNAESKVGILVDEDSSAILICEKERGRSAKIKTKIIKKLVPKKLRNGRKEKKIKGKEPDSINQECSFWGKDMAGRMEVLEEQENGDKVQLVDTGNQLASHLIQERREEEKRKGKENFDHGISGSRKGFQAEMEMVVTEEKLEIKRRGNSGCLIFFVIVLAGLAGGRILAFLLTVAACLMLKLLPRM